jgi:CRP-like cAMP-binding protein
MDNLEPILAEHAFLKDLEPRYLKLLAGCASMVNFPSNQIIFKEGEVAKQFFLIRSGHVALEIHTHRRGSIIVQTLGEGDVLGWSWFIEPNLWNFDARTIELTRAITVDAECVLNLCDEYPDFEIKFMRRFGKVLVDNIKSLRLQLVDFYGA